MVTTQDHIYPQAALGYRVWELKEGMLCPLFQGPAWRPGINLAYCLHRRHVAPAEECNCGFNAYHDIRWALAEAEAAWEDDYANATDVRTLIIGAIAAKGELQIHAQGFRCEYAQVLGICPLREWEQNLVPDQAYQLPVYGDAQQLEKAMEALPVEPVSVDLRPEGVSPGPRDMTMAAGEYTLGERIGAALLVAFILGFIAISIDGVCQAFEIDVDQMLLLLGWIAGSLLACLNL